MSDATKKELAREIRTKWAAYQASGLAGLRVQVLDRLWALGIRANRTGSDAWLGEVIHTFVRG